MARGGGSRAWQFLKRNAHYGEAWRAHAPAPGLEDAPFPVRRQAQAGRGAGRFGLLAWEDPVADGGPASPFWAVAPMLEAWPAPAKARGSRRSRARPVPRLPGCGSMTAR